MPGDVLLPWTQQSSRQIKADSIRQQSLQWDPWMQTLQNLISPGTAAQTTVENRQATSCLAQRCQGRGNHAERFGQQQHTKPILAS